MREWSYRAEVIRNGAKFTELIPTIAPTVTMNGEAEIKCSFSGTFLNNDSVNWLNDEIRLIQTIDGEDYPIGVFSVGTLRKNDTETGLETVSLECYDRCYRIKQTVEETTPFFAAGEKYTTAIKSLLVESGISLFEITESDKTLAYDREDWDIGTDNLTIVNDLLGEINYAPIYFDNSGMGVLKPQTAPTATNIKHRINYTDELNAIGDAVSAETDAFDTPNVFIVRCDNPEFENAMTAKAVNNNPMSSFSVLNRGRRIAKLYKVDNVADQETLDEYAAYLCHNSMLSTETVDIYTPNRPNHSCFDIVSVYHPKLQGTFVETGWDMSLEVGASMRHTLRRLIVI